MINYRIFIKPLSSETVIVEVFNGKEELVAVNSNSAMPEGDSIALGDVTPYKVEVYLEPTVDSTGYTFKTLVKGYIK